MRRRTLLLAGTGLLFAPAAARAAGPLPAPTPIGDDEGFVQFAILAERVSETACKRALRVRGWSATERAQLEAIAQQKTVQVTDLTAALGDTAPTEEDFTINLPESSFRDRATARATLERLEQLLVGTGVNATAFTADGGTRLLLSRVLVDDTRFLDALRAMRGAPLITAYPNPIDLDTAGTLLDALLTPKGYPEP